MDEMVSLQQVIGGPFPSEILTIQGLSGVPKTFFMGGIPPQNVAGVSSFGQASLKTEYAGIPTPKKLAKQQNALDWLAGRARYASRRLDQELEARQRDLAANHRVVEFLEILTFTRPVSRTQQELLAWRRAEFVARDQNLRQRIAQVASKKQLLAALQKDIDELLRKTREERAMLSERDLRILQAYTSIFAHLNG
jgi:hypothetical protein